MGLNEMLDQWIHTIGKEAIQAFQDNFSNLSGVSLCLVRLDGSPVTVASNRCLLCFRIEGANFERCASQHRQIIDRMVAAHSPVIASCYAGLSCFACPVIRGTEIIGAFFGGMVHSPASSTSQEPSGVATMSEEHLQVIVASLSSAVGLLKNVRVASDNTVETTGTALKDDFALTPREIMVLDQIIQGRSNRHIAESLFISEKTVKTHVTNILKKTGAVDRYELSRTCKKYYNS